MNLAYKVWALVLISSLILLGLTMRTLALSGIPISESLVIRGTSCLLLVFIYARQFKLTLAPSSLKTQVIRGVLAGLALTFISWSYNWLTASTVAVLSNMDVPLLMVFGPAIGVPSSNRSRLLALVSILLLIWYGTGLESQISLIYGLCSLILGTFLLCIGYLFIKKSMGEENIAVTIQTPALAIMIYGLIENLFQFGFSVDSHWTLQLLFLNIFSGVGMFMAYFATMKLYNITDLATAEFPTLIASVAIQPFEAIFLNEKIQLIFFAPAICFVIIIYLILKLQAVSPPNDLTALDKGLTHEPSI